MKSSILFSCLIGMMSLCSGNAFSQCETWLKSSEQENMENAYSIYKAYLHTGELINAYDHWEIVYESAPAADGRRSNVYSDGRIILEKMFYTEKTELRKKEIKDFILRLIDEQKQCYPESKIVYPSKDVMEFRQ